MTGAGFLMLGRKKPEKGKPLSAQTALYMVSRHIDECMAADDYDPDPDNCDQRADIVEQLKNMGASIQSSGLRYLPKDAATILSDLCKDAERACNQRDFEVIGGFDIGSSQDRMNQIKQVTVNIGLSLLKGGLAAIDGAVSAAKQPWYKADLPGETSRKNVADHLHWHATTLAGYTDKAAFYPPGDDLKKWVMQAFIEANAVEEGAAWQSNAWNQMWAEIGENIKQLPVAIAKTVGEVGGSLVSSFFGVPVWAVALGGAAILGTAGYFILKNPKKFKSLVRR